jgi:hypothetical protein
MPNPVTNIERRGGFFAADMEDDEVVVKLAPAERVLSAEKKVTAERGFDPRTAGLPAQSATIAPLCLLLRAAKPDFFHRLIY